VQILRKILTALFIAVILYFLGQTFYSNINQLKEFEFSFNIYLLIISFLIYGAGFVILSGASFYILKKMQRPVAFGTNLRYLLYGQFGSYVPGKVWLYVIRYKFLKNHGVSQSDWLSVFAIESVHIIGSAGVLAFALVSNFFLSSTSYILILVLLIAGIAIGLHPKIFYPVSNWLYKIIKRPQIPEDKHLNYGQLLVIFFFAAGYWLALALAFYIFVSSFIEVSIGLLPLLMGTFLLAYWLGLIALFMPSGLGVREGTITLLLTGTFVSSVAVLISLLTRVWSALNEVVWASVAFIINKLFPGGKKIEN